MGSIARLRAHTGTALLAVLAFAATVLVAPGAAPADAATRPAQGKPVWMQKQAIEGGRTTLVVRWPQVAGAKSYQLEWAKGMSVQVPGKSTRSGIRPPATGHVTTVVRGLMPGRIYCFQVRGHNRAGYGPRSPRHCKVTMHAKRAPSASPLVVDVGSWNTCSYSCADWATRAPKIRDRIASLNVGVMALQEAGNATSYIADHLAGHTQACQTGDGAAWRSSTSSRQDGQSVFVRDSAYAVVPGTANGHQFAAGKSHGACWVEVEHRATGRHLVVASVHLLNGKGDQEDRTRYAQTSTLLQMIADHYAQLGRPRPPLVLAGDFNSQRGRPYDAPRVRLEASGFHDAYDVAASYDSPPWLSSGHGWTSVPACSWLWGSHIDRIWAPPLAHVRSWRLVEPMASGRYTQVLSDHSALRVSMTIR